MYGRKAVLEKDDGNIDKKYVIAKTYPVFKQISLIAKQACSFSSLYEFSTEYRHCAESRLSLEDPSMSSSTSSSSDNSA